MKYMTKAKLRNIVNNNTTKEGAIFDYVIQALILISLVGYALGTLPNASLTMRSIFEWIETISVFLFTIEYALRIYVAKRPSKYIFSFYGLVDFLAIFPFYVSASTGFVTLRAFRVFRIFRTFKLIRYNKALKRFQQAWKIIREEVILYLIVTLVFLFLASAGIYYFENPVQPEKFTSIFSSGYWAIVTLTTVGYGDIYPITAGGRIFTFFILMIGVGIVTIPAGLVASALTKAREMEEEAHQAENEEITIDAYKENMNNNNED
jgi:voltage-gated potassium channel